MVVEGRGVRSLRVKGGAKRGSLANCSRFYLNCKGLGAWSGVEPQPRIPLQGWLVARCSFCFVLFFGSSKGVRAPGFGFSLQSLLEKAAMTFTGSLAGRA